MNKEVGNSEATKRRLFSGTIINMHSVLIASLCVRLVSALAYCIMKPVQPLLPFGSNLLTETESRISNGGICILPFSSLLSSLITAEVTSPVILSLLYIMHSLFRVYQG